VVVQRVAVLAASLLGVATWLFAGVFAGANDAELLLLIV
jgi:hypothetical protein